MSQDLHLKPYQGDLGPWPEFTISASAVKQLGICTRAVFFKRYAAWGGWDAPSDSWRRRAYVESKVRGLAAFIGLEVHAAASKALRDAANGYRPAPVETQVERALRGLDLAVHNTEARLWQGNPKKCPPLAEIYYNDPDTPEKLEKARARLRTLIEAVNGQVAALTASIIDKRIILLSNEQRFRRELTMPGVGKVVVWVSADAVLHRVAKPHNRLRIIDWKTSPLERYDADKAAAIIKADKAQVDLYALWAGAHYGCPPESMDMALHYVGQYKQRPDGSGPWPWIEVAQPTKASRQRAWDKLQKDAGRLAALIVDGDTTRNEPLPASAFPPLDEGARACTTCDFRGLCGRG